MFFGPDLSLFGQISRVLTRSPGFRRQTQISSSSDRVTQIGRENVDTIGVLWIFRIYLFLKFCETAKYWKFTIFSPFPRGWPNRERSEISPDLASPVETIKKTLTVRFCRCDCPLSFRKKRVQNIKFETFQKSSKSRVKKASKKQQKIENKTRFWSNSIKFGKNNYLKMVQIQNSGSSVKKRASSESVQIL